MSGQITLRVTMELLSDTIFGSGFSIPGGEDIAVCKDAAGYPYLKGSTLKGLLRESLENELVWTGGKEADLIALLGEDGWSGVDDGRRIHLTELTLDQRPTNPEKSYGSRTFTSLDHGVVKEGTLRTAACIQSGQIFSGELTCREEDAPLVKNALAGIKWAGTMRSRGFGRVRVRGTESRNEPAKLPSIPSACCICYRLRTETPVLITDLARSRENSYETRGYIPGSAIRGMVISALAAQDPDWFQENRTALLSDDTRFLNALPVMGRWVPLPAIQGFYEDKAETVFETVVKDGSFTPGLKRAKLGAFCALDGDTVHFWSPATDGSTRIRRNVTGTEEKTMFQTRGICAGQELEGYILLKKPELAEEIFWVLSDTVWLGADRYEGFGKCEVLRREAVDLPAWINSYGCRTQEEVGSTLYLLALSPLTMLDEMGDPCGIDTAALAKKLGVGRAEIQFCSTSMAEFGGYNRTWKCRNPAVRMYDQGSVFQIMCDCAPDLSALRTVEKEGLGIRRAEGFGQVVFLRKELFEGLRRKHAEKREKQVLDKEVAEIRRKKYIWVMENSGRLVGGKLSPSQIGSIQSLCEKAIAMGGDLTELMIYLEKNLTGRGVRHGERFRETGQLIQKVLETPLADTIQVKNAHCKDSMVERLRLLCLLFDFSRKENAGKE